MKIHLLLDIKNEMLKFQIIKILFIVLPQLIIKVF